MAERERGIGDNGGPKMEKFTAAKKIDRIREVLEMDITAHQKCVGVGIIVEADTDGIAAELSTKRLQTFASVSDRETVYRATKVLKEEQVAEAIKVKGKPNSYRVLPSSVVDAIVDAYNYAKDEAIYADVSSPLKPDTVAGRNPTAQLLGAVGSEGTTPSNHVGFDPTSKEKIPHTPLKENNKQTQQHTTTTVELVAARCGGDYLDCLNGSAVDLIAFISKHNLVDAEVARNMLATNIRSFSADVMLEAFSITLSKLPSGLIARPYVYLIETARRLKEGRAAKSAKGEALIPKSEKRKLQVDNAMAKVAAAKEGRRS